MFRDQLFTKVHSRVLMMESSRDERPDEYLLLISSTLVSVHCVTNYPHVSFLIMNMET